MYIEHFKNNKTNKQINSQSSDIDI